MASLEQSASIDLITPSEYGFLPVTQINQPYKSFISPVLIDKKMTLDQVKDADPAKPYKTRYGATSGTWTTNDFVEAVYRSLTR